MSKKNFSKKFVVGLFILLTIVFLWLVKEMKLRDKAQQYQSVDQSGERVKPSFDYTVSSIETDVILLKGEKGTMTVPMESVTVFKNDNEVPFQTLIVGDKVRLEFIPGEKAWIYIL